MKKYVDFDNPAHLNDLVDELREAIQELEDKLVASKHREKALENYSKHKSDCGYWTGRGWCTCGLQELLKIQKAEEV